MASKGMRISDHWREASPRRVTTIGRSPLALNQGSFDDSVGSQG